MIPTTLYLIDLDGSPCRLFETKAGVLAFCESNPKRAPSEYRITRFAQGVPEAEAFCGYNNVGQYLTMFRPLQRRPM